LETAVGWKSTKHRYWNFSKYSGSEKDDVVCRFLRIQMPDGTKEVVG